MLFSTKKLQLSIVDVIHTYPQTLGKLEDPRNFQIQKCDFHPGTTQNRNATLYQLKKQ